MNRSFQFYKTTMLGTLLCFIWGCSGNYYYGGPLTKIATANSGIIDTVSGVEKIYSAFPPSVLDRIIITSDMPEPEGQVIPVAELWAKCINFSKPSKDKLAQALQIKAAQLGAEMVVNVKFTIIPVLRIGKASGLAIKLNR